MESDEIPERRHQRTTARFSWLQIGLVVSSFVILAVVLGAIVIRSRGGDPQPTAAGPLDKRPVKVVITGTESAGEEVTDGGIAGLGVFKARGAVADHGTDTTYRKTTGPNDSTILLRYVTKGEKGTISYLVVIDTTRRPVRPRWRIWSATGAYKGLQGVGDESENATYTVSTLTGKVWR